MTALFIQAAERSGSTLLRYLVDTHPELCSPAELYLGRTLEALKVSLERSTAMLRPPPEREAFVISELRRVCGGMLDEYARGKGKRLWCEKTPVNLLSLELIDRVFPEARHVCLYRNCMDVVHSSLEAGRYGYVEGLEGYARRQPANLVAAMAESWADKVERMLGFELAHPDRCFRVKYEEVVFDPGATLPRLFGFLGVRWEPSIVETALRVPHDQGEGHSGDRKIRLTRKIERRVGAGSTISRAHLPASLLERINGLLRRLEYPEIGPDWDRSPSPYLPGTGGARPEPADR